jgi:glycosyltransferase involved in cell wall biosynthesis
MAAENTETDRGLSLIIPAYNEEKGIQGVVEEIKANLSSLNCPLEIIVVDDGSTDRTGDVIREIDGIRSVRHEVNKGYGAALKTGIRSASYPFVGITDADGTYPSQSIPGLLSAMEENGTEMVVGARTGGNVRIPLLRKPAKWTLSKIANYLAREKIPDLNSGLRIFRKKAVTRFFNILPDQFSFTTTITLAMLMNGFRVKFIPIDYHQRVGKSKIRPIYDTLNFLQLIVRTILYFDPLRIFLPLSLIFIVGGLLLLGHRIIFGHGFGVTSVVMLVAGVQMMALGMLADLINKRIMLVPED